MTAPILSFSSIHFGKASDNSQLTHFHDIYSGLMSPESLARSIESFLADAPNSVVVEDGQIAFDLGDARYSITLEHGKCVLHLWSRERNVVRRVLDAELKSGVLRLSVQKFGQAKPQTLEICRERDQRTPSAKKNARAAYQRILQRVIARACPAFKLDHNRLSSSMDLEHSFGPVYARGLIRKGLSAFAVLGVNAQETQSSIDAALTFALLWLDLCRERNALKFAVEGLKIFAPMGTSSVLRARVAHLQRSAKFEICELDQRSETLVQMDTADLGNIATRLVRCPDHPAVQERFSDATRKIRSFVLDAEVAVISPTEVSFRLYGMEFARARTKLLPRSFQQAENITFGAGAYETGLTAESEAQFAELMQRVSQSRRSDGTNHDPLWRMQPERWLESLIVGNVRSVDSTLDPAFVYSQVPAFSASDRAMIDVLTVTRNGRLAVLELKADEDIHLPLQGLDYWARVQWHHQRGEFQQFGYFTGKELASTPPLLYLVAPALRVHPATDTILKYFAAEIDWQLLGINENWRDEVRVVFRKSKGVSKATSTQS